MRRLIASILLSATLFIPFVPAQAQGAPILKDTTDAKERIDGYVNYMTSTELLVKVEDDVDGITVTLPKGLFIYVESWVDVFQHAHWGSLALSDYAVGAPGINDSTKGEGVNGWYSYCGKYKDFLLKVQELSNRVVTAGSSPLATAEMQTKMAEINRSAAAIAMNSMTLDIAKGGGSAAVNGNATCAKALADMSYSFRNAPESMACVYNILQSPSSDFHNDSGGCSYKLASTISFPVGAMPACFTGTACTPKATTNCKSTDCFWYDFRSARARLDENLQLYEASLADVEKKFAEVGGALAKAGLDAAALKTSLKNKGSVLTLPLPLSDITVAGVIARVINALLGVVGAIALLMFVWGGFTWMTAAGSQEKIGKAKKTITWAALGLIAIFGSYAILNVVIEAFSK